MQLIDHLRTGARASRLANHRLHTAMAPLSRAEFQAPRTGFFPSLAAMHQTHHRGQVHAMLAGTAVAPPQLDEFLMPSDAPLRAADMRTLGWSEADLFTPSRVTP